MATRSQKRFLMRLVLWVLIAGAIFMMGAAGLAAWHVFVKERDAKRGLDIAETEYADLETRKTDLERKLKALSTERGVDEVIRERYPVAKPGEEVITIVNPRGGASRATTTASRSLWETISSWFSW